MKYNLCYFWEEALREPARDWPCLHFSSSTVASNVPDRVSPCRPLAPEWAVKQSSVHCDSCWTCPAAEVNKLLWFYFTEIWGVLLQTKLGSCDWYCSEDNSRKRVQHMHGGQKFHVIGMSGCIVWCLRKMTFLRKERCVGDNLMSCEEVQILFCW